MAPKRVHKLHRYAQESKRVDGRAHDREQEELHLKVPHSVDAARRQAAQSAWEPHRETRQRAEKDRSG